MLLNDEYTIVVDSIAYVINVDASPRGLVSQAFLDASEQQRFLSELPLTFPTSRDAALSILGQCLKDRWTASPCWLATIVEYVNVRVQSPILANVVRRAKAKQDPTANVFDKAWLNQLPFFDRASFRPLVKKLIMSTDLPVLRINGPSGCGCTYTARALEEFASQFSHQVLVLPAEVPDSEATVYQLEDLVGELLTPVPGAGPVPTRSASSYPAQMARYVLGTAANQPQTMVFVIDGAGGPNVNQEIKLFVAGLAKEICKLANRRRARLVLINHQQKLNVLDVDVRDETVPPASALQAADLERCIVDMESVRVAAGIARLAAPAKDLAEQLLLGAPLDPKRRLGHLNGRLVDLFAS